MLERELKKELLKAPKPDDDEINLEPEATILGQDQQLPVDLLLNERINAKLFKVKLKRIGVVLSMWEIFSIFDHLNIQMAKVFYEPQRYHHILFEHFFSMVTGQDYRQRIGAIKAEAEAVRAAEEAKAQAD